MKRVALIIVTALDTSMTCAMIVLTVPETLLGFRTAEDIEFMQTLV
jgi:hypothetical protein